MLFCYINCDFGSDYQKNCKSILKEISVFANIKTPIHKKINTLFDSVHEDIKYMEFYYEHVVGQEIFLTLKNIVSQLKKIEKIERKTHNYLKEDVETLEAFKASITALIALVSNEKLQLSEKIKENNEHYKKKIMSKSDYTYNVFTSTEEIVTKLGNPSKRLKTLIDDIRRIVDSPVTYYYASTMNSLYNDLLQQTTWNSNTKLPIFYDIVENLHQRRLKGPLESKVEYILQPINDLSNLAATTEQQHQD